MSKVLVTGASGFIGAHLCPALVARGDEVTALVRTTSRVDVLGALGVRLAYGDMTDPGSLRAAVAGTTVVYHLAGCIAATHCDDFYRINAEGTARLAQICAEQPRPPILVVVSSLAAAGPTQAGRPRVESDRPVQVSSYGRSKRLGELAAQRLADRLPITVVRPPIVFGPWDRMTLPMFRSIARTGTHLLPGIARPRFSLIHAGDLAKLLILAAERGARLQPPTENGCPPGRGFYFAACESTPSYADLGRMIGALAGRRRVATLPAPFPLIWILATGGELVGRVTSQPLLFNRDKAWEITSGSWVCSPQAAIDELEFAVDAPLKERLRETIHWYRQQNWL